MQIKLKTFSIIIGSILLLGSGFGLFTYILGKKSCRIDQGGSEERQSGIEDLKKLESKLGYHFNRIKDIQRQENIFYGRIYEGNKGIQQHTEESLDYLDSAESKLILLLEN